MNQDITTKTIPAQDIRLGMEMGIPIRPDVFVKVMGVPRLSRGLENTIVVSTDAGFLYVRDDSNVVVKV